MIKQDIESLLGVVSSSDDPTKLVYDLIKNTAHKKDLLCYRKLCADKQLERRLEEIANRHTKNNNARKEDNRGLSFSQWISRQGCSVPVHGDVSRGKKPIP